MELPPLRTWPALLLTDSELSESCLHSPPLSVRASQWLSTFHFPVRAKRTSVPLHVMLRPEQHTCFYFLSIRVSGGEQSTALLSDFLSKWRPHSQCPAGFSTQRKEDISTQSDQSLPLISCPFPLPFPTWAEKGRLYVSSGLSSAFLFHIPDFDLLLGPQYALGAKRKSSFSDNIPPEAFPKYLSSHYECQNTDLVKLFPK